MSHIQQHMEFFKSISQVYISSTVMITMIHKQQMWSGIKYEEIKLICTSYLQISIVSGYQIFAFVIQISAHHCAE